MILQHFQEIITGDISELYGLDIFLRCVLAQFLIHG